VQVEEGDSKGFAKSDCDQTSHVWRTKIVAPPFREGMKVCGGTRGSEEKRLKEVVQSKLGGRMWESGLDRDFEEREGFVHTLRRKEINVDRKNRMYRGGSRTIQQSRDTRGCGGG